MRSAVKRLFCAVCVVLLFSASCRTLSKTTIQTATGRISVFVELATTPEEREKGLMFRKKLPENQGMLFVYPEEILPSFWMKNTLVSLDIIFINKAGRIVFIAQNTTPLSEDLITPTTLINRALEVNAGFAERHKIKAGDLVIFDETDPK